MVSGYAAVCYWNPDGSIGWTGIWQNGVTTEGVNFLLNTGFLGLPQPATIYALLIDQGGYSAVNVADQHNSHPGWNEWAGISNPTRPVWSPAAANGGLMGTGTPARFFISADGQIIGASLTTISGIGSLAAGVLYNTAVAIDPLDVANGGTLDVSFAVRLRE
jgi:hypothetical protein